MRQQNKVGIGAGAEKIHDRFVRISSEIANSFPSLDLRFSMRSDSSKLRFWAEGVSARVFELDLSKADSRAAVYQAVLAIKEAARLYDA